MEWRSHFNAAFFSVWEHHGFPNPAEHTRRYEALRRTAEPPAEWLTAAAGESAAVSSDLLRNVYTFGALVGRLFGRLLAVPGEEIERRADWCGRFNTGISLFDYVSDEEQREDLIFSQPFLQLLPNQAPPARKPIAPSPAETLLRQIATSVMRDLANTPEEPHPDDPMWRELRAMMQAEVTMSRARIGMNPPITSLLAMARTKSAGPFRCMAEWMSLGAPQSVRALAGELGEAVGDCYWLVDDARDLWEDLDAGRWNLFLLTSAKQDPNLFAAAQSVECEMRLSAILLSRGWARRIITPVIAKLHETMEKVPAGSSERQEIAAFLGVSMERWLR